VRNQDIEWHFLGSEVSEVLRVGRESERRRVYRYNTFQDANGWEVGSPKPGL
jgi:hypothetical protein